MDRKMDREQEIIHKVLDGDAEEEEHDILSRGMEADARLKKEYAGLTNAVRLLRESERRAAPLSFTAEVMKKLPEKSLSMRGRVREFLLGSRVLRWNMASMLAMAVIVLVTVVTVYRVHHETTGPIVAFRGQDEAAIPVQLIFHAPQAQRVAVAGDFNKWKTDAQEMKKTDGNWIIVLKLKPGVYSYNFVVDGKAWVPDPGAEFYEDDGYGSRNSVLRINI